MMLSSQLGFDPSEDLFGLTADLQPRSLQILGVLFVTLPLFMLHAFLLVLKTVKRNCLWRSELSIK